MKVNLRVMGECTRKQGVKSEEGETIASRHGVIVTQKAFHGHSGEEREYLCRHTYVRRCKTPRWIVVIAVIALSGAQDIKGQAFKIFLQNPRP